MRYRLPLAALLSALSLSWIGATPPQRTAYADVGALLTAHPLYGVLAHYDREIAALKQTLSPNFSTSIEQRLDRAADATRRDAAAARAHAPLAASDSVASDRADENAALSAVSAGRRFADESMRLYAARLQRESAAVSAAYARAGGIRVDRAVSAREQQLREKELDVAYDLARKNGPARLRIRLALNELHPDPKERARLEAELAALSRQELTALSRMQAADAVTLSKYRGSLDAQAAAQIAQMNAQLRAKAAANLALRRRVLSVASRGSTAALSKRIAAFRAAYPSTGNATAIASAFSESQADIAQRFAQIEANARASRAQASVQIAIIARQRNALRSAIVEQIKDLVEREAARRHLNAADLSGRPPRGGIDVTNAVRAQLSQL